MLVEVVEPYVGVAYAPPPRRGPAEPRGVAYADVVSRREPRQRVPPLDPGACGIDVVGRKAGAQARPLEHSGQVVPAGKRLEHHAVPEPDPVRPAPERAQRERVGLRVVAAVLALLPSRVHPRVSAKRGLSSFRVRELWLAGTFRPLTAPAGAGGGAAAPCRRFRRRGMPGARPSGRGAGTHSPSATLPAFGARGERPRAASRCRALAIALWPKAPRLALACGRGKFVVPGVADRRALHGDTGRRHEVPLAIDQRA